MFSAEGRSLTRRKGTTPSPDRSLPAQLQIGFVDADCQGRTFSAIVQALHCVERPSEKKNFGRGSGGDAGSFFVRDKVAGAGVAGEFEPGNPDLDWRRARD